MFISTVLGTMPLILLKEFGAKLGPSPRREARQKRRVKVFTLSLKRCAIHFNGSNARKKGVLVAAEVNL